MILHIPLLTELARNSLENIVTINISPLTGR
jgi:hypothetical protein